MAIDGVYPPGLPVAVVDSIDGGVCIGSWAAGESFADLVDKLMPTVVNITTTQNVPQQGGPRMRDMPQLPPSPTNTELPRNAKGPRLSRAFLFA